MGSGQRKFTNPPWINIDSQARWSPDVVADAAHLPQFADGSSDMIVLHHVLEHFGCGEAKELLKECYRLLCSGGSLIVCVPDMHKLAQAWLRGSIDTQIYMTSVYGAYMGSEDDRHKWGFSAITLYSEICKVGHWMGYRAFDYRKIDGADIARDDSWILAVEAVK